MNKIANTPTKDEILNRVWDKLDAEKDTARNANDYDYLEVIFDAIEDVYNTLNS